MGYTIYQNLPNGDSDWQKPSTVSLCLVPRWLILGWLRTGFPLHACGPLNGVDGSSSHIKMFTESSTNDCVF